MPLSRRKCLRLLGAGAGALVLGPRLGWAEKINTMKTKPKAVVLDVIETCFAIDPLSEKLKALGLPEGSLKVWFPRVLRDAFALQVTGTYKPFGEIATGTLGALLAENDLEADPAKMKEVIQAFATLPVHPDVKEGIAILRDAGIRVAALTNGSAETTRKMFANAGLETAIEKFISIEEVKQWKPAAAVYLHAAKSLGVKPEELALVAAHDWDIDGAGRAGLTTGYVARKQPRGSAAMRPPDVSGGSLPEVARALLALGAAASR